MTDANKIYERTIKRGLEEGRWLKCTDINDKIKQMLTPALSIINKMKEKKENEYMFVIYNSDMNDVIYDAAKTYDFAPFELEGKIKDQIRGLPDFFIYLDKNNIDAKFDDVKKIIEAIQKQVIDCL